MDEQLLLQRLPELSLEDGKRILQEYCDASGPYASVGVWLEEQALDKLYAPLVSLKFAEFLVFLGQYVHDAILYALGLKAKGDALVQIGHYRVAMQSLEESGMVFLQQGDENNWARSRISWTVACAWLGSIDEALHEAQRAREVFVRLGELLWACIIDNNIAVIFDNAGRYQEALALYERMRATYLSLADQDSPLVRRNIALTDLNQAINLAWLGNFKQAYTLQHRARDSFHALGQVNLELIAEVNIADLDYMQGYYGSALRRYYHALDVLEHSFLDDLSRIAKVKLWTANCLIKLNRAQEARRLSNEAVIIYRQFDVSLTTALALLTYAAALEACKQIEDAIVALSEAQELFLQSGFEHHAVTSQLQKIELLLESGDATVACAQARLIKRFCESRNLVSYTIRAELIISSALLAMIFRSEASNAQRDMWMHEITQLCRNLVHLSHKHNLREATYKGYYLLGQIAFLQGNVEKTGRYFRTAIIQIERILDDLLYDLSPAFLSTAWTVYADMIVFYLTQGQAERAFTLLEQGRSMALLQYLRHPKHFGEGQGQQEEQEEEYDRASVASPRMVLLRAQEELKDWQERYRRYSMLLSNLDSSISTSINRETIQEELKRCENKISELFERVSLYQEERLFLRHAPDGEKRMQRSHLDLAMARQSLAPHQTLLSYFFHERRLIIFVLNARELIWREIPDGVEQLENVLPFLYARIQLGSQFNQQPSQKIICLLLQKLYALLIAPVEDLLPEESGLLTIVPYKSLHSFPFHALFDGTRFLIEKFQIHYLPAYNLLSENNAFGPYPETSAEKSQSTLPLLIGYSDKGLLPHALEEVKQLTGMLHGQCYLEEEATIAQLEQEASGSPIIHVATHGLSRLDAPNFSFVQLADGRLNALDAFNLDLRGCELVTLSGCETGLSLSGGGDEQLGLGRAFLAAGAKSLLMSLWPVEDKMTGEFMRLFYRYLLQGFSKVEALRVTQREFLANTESGYTHPYFWAAFRLVGDISPLKWKPAIANARPE